MVFTRFLGYSLLWPWPFDPKILISTSANLHTSVTKIWWNWHLPWHRSHQKGINSGWYCDFPAHLPWTTYHIGWNSVPVQHVLKEGGGRTDQTRDSTSNRGCSCTAFTPYLHL